MKQITLILLGVVIFITIPVFADPIADNPLVSLYETASSVSGIAVDEEGTGDSNVGEFDITGQIPATATIDKAYVFFGCESLGLAGQVDLSFAGSPLLSEFVAKSDTVSSLINHNEYVWDVTDYINPANSIYSFIFSPSTTVTSHGALLLVIYDVPGDPNRVEVKVNHGADFIQTGFDPNISYSSFSGVSAGSGKVGVFVVRDDPDVTSTERLILNGTNLLGPGDVYHRTGGLACSWREADVVFQDRIVSVGVDPEGDALGLTFTVAVLVSPGESLPTPSPTDIPTATPTPEPTEIPTETPLPTETPICVRHGDVNFIDGITAADAQLAFIITIGSMHPTFDEACAADCNADGDVTAGDSQLIFATAIGVGNCADPLP